MSNWHRATEGHSLAYADVILTDAVVNHYGSPLKAAWERAQVVLRDLVDVEWERDSIGEIVDKRDAVHGIYVYRVYARPVLAQEREG